MPTFSPPPLPKRLRWDNPVGLQLDQFLSETEGKRERMLERLAAAGWPCIGHGYFSDVFLTPCGQYVVRVSPPDEGYEAYLRFLQGSLSSNPYTPKIFYHVPLIDTTRGYSSNNNRGHVTVVERLEPFSPALRPVVDRLRKVVVTSEADMSTLADDADLLALAKALNHRGSRIYLDLKEDNMMRRGDRLVVTDPFYGRDYLQRPKR